MTAVTVTVSCHRCLGAHPGVFGVVEVSEYVVVDPGILGNLDAER